MADANRGPSNPRRGGHSTAVKRNVEHHPVGKKPRNAVVESIREATGASVEDIQYQLRECEGDVNKATEQLLDTPFTVVRTKKGKPRPMAPKGRRGNGREHLGGRGHPPEGYMGGRGRGGSARGKGGMRNKLGGGGRGRAEKETKETEAGVNGTVEIEKTKPAAPPAPVRKHYLEALCGKSKMTAPMGVGDAGKSGFLAQKQGLASFAASGWETSSPPETPVAAFRDSVTTEDLPSEEEKSVHVDSVADVRTGDEKEDTHVCVDEDTQQEARDEAVEEIPEVADVFPYPMKDIRFTRPDTTPVMSLRFPGALKIESTFMQMPNLEDVPLDMSTIEYLFGTFAGLSTAPVEPPAQLELLETPEPIPEQAQVEENVSPFIPETEEVEIFESTPLLMQRQTEEAEVETRLQSLKRSSVEYLNNSADASQPLTADVFSSSKPSDFRLDVTAQELDVELPPPVEQRSFLLTENTVKEEPKPVHSHLIGSDAPRAEQTYMTSTSGQDPSPQHPSLENTSDFVKPYQDSFNVAVESQKKEDLVTFDAPEPRSQPQRQPPSITETKPVMETEPAFGMSSGPAPTLPMYQSQRHQPPPHKLQEKSVPPPVGPGVPNHQHNSKYSTHPSVGVPPPTQNQNPAVHVPASLNANSNPGNQSLPLMQQVPFVNTGMMPNPAMPFHAGSPYYPQYLQYQHQIYHGMYAAGTYGGFGAPFNHESVGHPAHTNPVGVPPNQGNQQFPVSFPNALYPLGNTVYDNANSSSFPNNKEKDNVFLNQQQLPHAGFPGAHQPVPRNDPPLFYGVHGQAFSQGFRNQFHQPPGFAGQFPGGGFVAPTHPYHPPGQQGNKFRLH